MEPDSSEVQEGSELKVEFAREEPVQDDVIEEAKSEAVIEEEPVSNDPKEPKSILDDERALIDIMNEDANKVYGKDKVEEKPEYTVVDVKTKEPEEPKESSEIKKSSDEPKNPIDNVDLMDYFKFNLNGHFYFDGMDFELKKGDRIALLMPDTGG